MLVTVLLFVILLAALLFSSYLQLFDIAGTVFLTAQIHLGIFIIVATSFVVFIVRSARLRECFAPAFQNKMPLFNFTLAELFLIVIFLLAMISIGLAKSLNQFWWSEHNLKTVEYIIESARMKTRGALESRRCFIKVDQPLIADRYLIKARPPAIPCSQANKGDTLLVVFAKGLFGRRWIQNMKLADIEATNSN